MARDSEKDCFRINIQTVYCLKMFHLAKTHEHSIFWGYPGLQPVCQLSILKQVTHLLGKRQYLKTQGYLTNTVIFNTTVRKPSHLALRTLGQSPPPICDTFLIRKMETVAGSPSQDHGGIGGATPSMSHCAATQPESAMQTCVLLLLC